MLFNSYFFILAFLPLCAAGYYIVCRFRHYQAYLLYLILLSGWFYAAAFLQDGRFSWKGFLALPVTIGLNYLCAWGMKRTTGAGGRRLLYAAGLAGNLGLLFYCKYFNFFLENLNAVFRSDLALRELFLPLGVSFFTFQQIAYLADCYRGEAQLYTPLEYTAYVMFFPKLSQGPLARHEELIAQFRDESRRRPDYAYLSRGLYQFSLGLAKKVLLADTFGKLVNLGYANVWDLDPVNGLLVMVGYSLQIYFDFSGYCDMAMGIANLLHLDLPLNFRSPYKAVNIADFWKRWHITLTQFLTRYVYIPLGGNRKGKVRTYCNVLLVFLISGLWHGANWTFVLWGAFNGLCMVFDRLCGRLEEKLWKPFRVAVTFLVTTFAWSLFRSPNLGSFRGLMYRVFRHAPEPVHGEFMDVVNDLAEVRILCRLGLQGLVDRLPGLPLALLFAGSLAGVFFLRNTQEKAADGRYGWKRMAVTVLLLVWGIASLSEVTTFLYFRF